MINDRIFQAESRLYSYFHHTHRSERLTGFLSITFENDIFITME